jgi:hypothetical protein
MSFGDGGEILIPSAMYFHFSLLLFDLDWYRAKYKLLLDYSIRDFIASFISPEFYS